MKQFQIVKASNALDCVFKNSSIIKPMHVSYALYKLRKKFQEHLDWQIGQQDAINERLDADGLTGPDREAAYNAALAEVIMSEVEQDWEPVRIPQDAEIVINPTDFIYLEGFVEVM